MNRILLSLLVVGCSGRTDDGNSDDWDALPSDTDWLEGTDCPDGDGDGWGDCDDCDDNDKNVFPGAPERCNGKDDDCDHQNPYEELVGEARVCAACETAGYFSTLAKTPAEGMGDAVAGLGTIACTYSAATDYMFLQLDRVGDLVECVYTGRTVQVFDEKPDPTVMNTEHSWPQSLGAADGVKKCDLNHLYPTDAAANTARSSNPYGQVISGTQWSDGGARLGYDAHGTLVFEPRAAHKGNAARSMMYFANRYGYPLSAAEVTLYRSWNTQDPIDAIEVDRALKILERQGNANAFVVCPFVLDAIYPAP